MLHPCNHGKLCPMRLHPGKTEAPVRCEYHKEAQLFHNGSQLMARAPQTETGQRRPSRGEGPVEALAGTCPSAPEEATPGPCPRTRYAKPRTEAECSAAEHSRARQSIASLHFTQVDLQPWAWRVPQTASKEGEASAAK